jgi:hypothetical protein
VTEPPSLFAPAPGPDGPAVCSARACRGPATWGLLWNNPKLHPPERRKVWTACDEHRENLETFLRLRGFLRSTVPVSELEAAPRTTEPPGGAT